MVVFGVELDCGKRGSLGAGVYQPADTWEVRERLLEGEEEKRIFREQLGGRIFGHFWRAIRLWKAWRSRSLGAGVYQPEDAWEVREGLLEGEEEKRIFIAVRKQHLEVREKL